MTDMIAAIVNTKASKELFNSTSQSSCSFLQRKHWDSQWLKLLHVPENFWSCWMSVKRNPGCLCMLSLPWTGARFCALLPATAAGAKLSGLDDSASEALSGHRAKTPREGRKVGFGNGTFGRWDGWWKRLASIDIHATAIRIDILSRSIPCNRCDWSFRFCLDQSPTKQRLTVEFCPLKMLVEITWVAKVAKMCSQPSSAPLSFQDVTE